MGVWKQIFVFEFYNQSPNVGTRFNVLLSSMRASHLFNDFPERSLGVAFLGHVLHLLAREQHDSSSLEWKRLACGRAGVLTEARDALPSFRPTAHLFAFTPDHRGDGAGHETGREATKQSHLPVHRHNVPRWKTKPTSCQAFFVTARPGDRADRASLTVGEEAGQVQDSPSKQGGAHSGRQRFVAHLEAAVTELEQTRCIMGKQNQNQAIFV